MSTVDKPAYWAVLPAEVRYDEELKPNAKLLYAEISALANATGYCWATNEHFGELFGLGSSTISRLVSQLEDRGYIRTEMAATEKGSERRIYAGIFQVRVRRGGLAENGKGGLAEKSNTPLAEKSKGGLADFGKQNNTSNNIYTPYSPPKGGRRVRRAPRTAPDWQPERFDGLWRYYPKVGRKDKQRAMDEWDKLRPDEALIDTIARALKRLNDFDEQWKRDIGVPHLFRFLRDRRWEDAAELGPVHTDGETAGWADDPEVI